LAGVAVPLALTGSASAAKAPPGPPAITKCSPATATIGKNVTIHGTDLTGATKVTIDAKAVTINANTARAIKVIVPTGIKTKAPDTVKAFTPNGTATGACSFQPPKKKSHK
jgi:flagellar hook assembly protein FlgD